MRVVGVDPGLKGALACVELDTMSVVGLEDMPTCAFVDGRMVPDVRAITKLLKAYRPGLIVIEHVEPRPGDGRVSAWRFASGFGALLAAAQLYDGDERRVCLVRPRIWKEALGLSSDKSASLELARSYFSDVAEMLARKKDDGRAEALLLCEYHRRFVVPQREVEVI